MFTIRRAILSDAEHLPAVETSSGQAFSDVPGLEWVADHGVMTAEDHQRWIADGAVWVAQNQSVDLVAFISCEIVRNHMHIWELAVHADAQRAGLGRRMVQTAIDHAKQTDLIDISFTTFNDVAFNAPFYAQLGFKIIDEDDLDKRLRLILQNEAENGLPAERRCAMQMLLNAED